MNRKKIWKNNRGRDNTGRGGDGGTRRLESLIKYILWVPVKHTQTSEILNCRKYEELN